MSAAGRNYSWMVSPAQRAGHRKRLGKWADQIAKAQDGWAIDAALAYRDGLSYAEIAKMMGFRAHSATGRQWVDRGEKLLAHKGGGGEGEAA